MKVISKEILKSVMFGVSRVYSPEFQKKKEKEFSYFPLGLLYLSIHIALGLFVQFLRYLSLSCFQPNTIRVNVILFVVLAAVKIRF